ADTEGEVNSQLGTPTEAVTSSEPSPEDTDTQPPSFSTLFKDGITNANKSEILSLDKQLEKQLYQDPSNTDYLKQYAELQYHLGHIDNSLTLYYQYLSMVPNDVTVMSRVGDTHRRLGQFDKCINVLEKAYPIEPKDLTIISNLATAYRAKKQYKKAEFLLQRGLSFNPKDSNLLILLAQCFNKQNLPEKGEETIRKQLFMSPDHIPALIILTESLLIQHRTIDAESSLKRAETLDTLNKHTHLLGKLRHIIEKTYSANLLTD
ncbi:MAG: tetratricopeptide repeat protein, partial [Candidatus Margulisiibacteriota bacterium]